MKKNLVLTLGLAVVLAAAVAAISQEAAAPAAHKPKPSAARVAPQPTTPPAATPATSPATAPMPAPPPATAPRRETPGLALNEKTESMAAADALTLPVGTTLRIKLDSAISTSTSKPGDTFAARVTEAVVVDGKTMIPAGSAVEGRVAHVSSPRRIRGVAMLDLRPESVTMPGGMRYNLAAVVVDTNDPKHHDVDEEGRIKGRGHDMADWRNLAVGGGVGAIVGAVVMQSGKATLIGAGIGTSAAIVHWLVKRRSEQLPSGTELFLELSRPMSLSAAAGSEPKVPSGGQ